MEHIPHRENLESMSRTDIQKLCKDYNIKANMRTDEMINALCDLVNGKEVPRPHRSTSERVTSQNPPKSRLSSLQPPGSKATEIAAKKAALQPSESNTDAESVADTPASAPTTRRRAKDLQMHLGKGRPVLAGGNGARDITKVVSRGAGRKAKASAMLQEDPIPEEDETEGKEVPPKQHAEADNKNKATRPYSVSPLSPISGTPGGSCDEQPPHLPTPAPSHPSYSFPSAQLSALETRVTHLEQPDLAARISRIEAALTDIPTLKASVAQIPALQDEIRRLETTQRNLEAEVTQWGKSHADLKVRVTSLEVHIKGLVVENGALKDANDTLKERVAELETRLGDLADARREFSMSSVIIHSPRAKSPDLYDVGEDEEKGAVGRDGEKEPAGKAEEKEPTSKQAEKQPARRDAAKEPAGKSAERHGAVVASVPNLARITYINAHLPNPSPSQPTLGKRTRGGVETPDVSLSEIPDDAPQYEREAAEHAAIHRLIRPKKKKARLDSDPDEDAPPPFSFFQQGPGGPSSTSTPQRRSDSPPGFFTAGGRAPTPLARTDEEAPSYLSMDVDDSVIKSTVVAGPSSDRAPSPVEAAPHTPPSQTVGTRPPSRAENPLDSMHDPEYFGPLPAFYPQTSHLPFPLVPNTPLNAQDILERSTQLAAPSLGEPWKFDASANPANISHLGDGVAQPATPGSVHNQPSSSTAAPPASPGEYTFRAGGRKERNDKYNPFFTPERAPGGRQRTGITPTRGFSFSLRSPAKMATVEEGVETGPEAEEAEEIVRSPPQLKTLYGTELQGDTRFGDYGRDLGRYDWGKFVPR